MKIIAILISLFYYSLAESACTTISRTNNSANQVLTSTKYNLDLNTVYTAVNSLDGECLQSGTIQPAALDSAEFTPLYKGIRIGFKASYSDSNTISVSKGTASVNDAFVEKSTATTVTWGCTDCSAQAASTNYYVYIRDTSSGTTVNLLISTTGPNADGYNATSDLVIARFHNDGNQDIDQYSIDQWNGVEFIPQETGWVDGGTLSIDATTTAPTKGTTSVDKVYWRRDGSTLVARYRYRQTAGGSNGSGEYLISLPNSYSISASQGSASSNASETIGKGHVTNTTDAQSSATHSARLAMYDTTQFRMLRETATVGTQEVIGSGLLPLGTTTGFSFDIRVPITNWSY